MSEDLFGEVVVIKRNGSDGARFPFRTSQCIFGRNQECDIRIQLANVAQEHAKLFVDNGKVLLQNLSDGAPTLLNKEEIQTHQLKHNDIFTITERSFRFELPERRRSGRRSSTSKKTPLKALQGSPRTPVAGESLKKSITKLRRTSSVVHEDEEAALSTTPESSRKCKENTPEEELLQTTPSILKKRKSISTAERKRVSFGEKLSPELFDKRLPPSTPLKKGKSPNRPRRLSEPLLPITPTGRRKQRCSVGNVLGGMPIVEEEDEVVEDKQLIRSAAKLLTPIVEAANSEAVDCQKEKQSLPIQPDFSLIPLEEEHKQDNSSSDVFEMAVNEAPVHVAALSDTPPQNLPPPLISTNAEDEMKKDLAHKLATPIRENIEQGVTLKATKKKMPTPLRKDIKKGLTLKSARMKMSTPVRKQIQSGVALRPTRQRMHTPLRKEIHARPKLRQRRRTLPVASRTDRCPDEDLYAFSAQEERIEDETVNDTTENGISNESPDDCGERIEETPESLDGSLNDCRETSEIASEKTQEDISVLAGTPPPHLQSPLISTATEAEESSVKVDENKKRKLATPLRENIRQGVRLRETKRKLATPIRKDIKRGATLRATKKKLATPLRNQIKSGIPLRATRQKMHTPLRKEIHSKPALRKIYKRMATPLRKGIESQPELKVTKRKIATPLRKDIEEGIELRQTKPSMAEELQAEIKSKPKLRSRMKKIATPLRRQIQEKPKLNATKKTMATPLRTEIKRGLKLKETKKKMATPLRTEIKRGLTLRETKKKMATPLKKEIETGVELRKTKPSMAEELQEDIKSRPKLRATKKAMATPLRKDIKRGLKLRETKKKLATPLRKGIQSRPELKSRKRKMATPLRSEIEEGIELRKTKPVMTEELQEEIKSKPKLRATKKAMATPLRKDIKRGLKLKATKKKLATPLRKAILSRPELKSRTRRMATPLRNEIKEGVELNQTKPAMVKELQEEIKSKPKLRATKKTMDTPLKEIKRGVKLRETKKKLNTPLRQDIESQPELKQTSESEESNHLPEAIGSLAENNQKTRQPPKKRVCRRSTPQRMVLLRQQALRCAEAEVNNDAEKLDDTDADSSLDVWGTPEADLSSYQPRPSGSSMFQDLHDEMSPVIAIEPVFVTRVQQMRASVASNFGSFISETSDEEGDFERPLPSVMQPQPNADNDLCGNEQPSMISVVDEEDISDLDTSFSSESSTVYEKSEDLEEKSDVVIVEEKSKDGEGKESQTKKDVTVEENFGLEHLLRTPKVKATPVEENLGLDRLLKTPKVKNTDVSMPLEENLGIDRLLKTPKEKSKPVEENFGLDELMQTPRDGSTVEATQVEEDVSLEGLVETPEVKIVEEAVTVEENLGLDRLLKTPKVKSKPVEENFGLVRLLKTPKEKPESSTVEGHFGLNMLMKTPKDRAAEKAMPVEENFGLQRLMHTPKNKPAAGACMEEHFGLKRLMQTPKDRENKESVGIEGDFGLDEMMKTPGAVEAEEGETSCLDGLLIVSKMEIHRADEAVEDQEESESISKGENKKQEEASGAVDSDQSDHNAVVLEDEATTTAAKKTRSSARKSLRSGTNKSTEEVVETTSIPVEEDPSTEAKDSSLMKLKEVKPKMSGRRKSTRRNSLAEESKDSSAPLAGDAQGAAVTPATIPVTKTSLISIPEETDADLKTPAVKQAVIQGTKPEIHSSEKKPVIEQKPRGRHTKRSLMQDTLSDTDAAMQETKLQISEQQMPSLRRPRRGGSSEVKQSPDEPGAVIPVEGKVQPARQSRRNKRPEQEETIAEVPTVEDFSEQTSADKEKKAIRKTRRGEVSEVASASQSSGDVKAQEGLEPVQGPRGKKQPVRQSKRGKLSDLEESSTAEVAVEELPKPTEQAEENRPTRQSARSSVMPTKEEQTVALKETSEPIEPFQGKKSTRQSKRGKASELVTPVPEEHLQPIEQAKEVKQPTRPSRKAKKSELVTTSSVIQAFTVEKESVPTEETKVERSEPIQKQEPTLPTRPSRRTRNSAAIEPISDKGVPEVVIEEPSKPAREQRKATRHCQKAKHVDKTATNDSKTNLNVTEERSDCIEVASAVPEQTRLTRRGRRVAPSETKDLGMVTVQEADTKDMDTEELEDSIQVVTVSEPARHTRRGRKAEPSETKAIDVRPLEIPDITALPVRRTRRGKIPDHPGPFETEAAEECVPQKPSVDVTASKRPRRGRAPVAEEMLPSLPRPIDVVDETPCDDVSCSVGTKRKRATHAKNTAIDNSVNVQESAPEPKRSKKSAAPKSETVVVKRSTRTTRSRR